MQNTGTCPSNAPQSQPHLVNNLNNFDGFKEPIQNTWSLNPRKRQHGDNRTVRQFKEVDRDVNGNQLVDTEGKQSVLCAAEKTRKRASKVTQMLVSANIKIELFILNHLVSYNLS